MSFIGGSDKVNDDICKVNKDTQQSTGPMSWFLDTNRYESCSKCTTEQFYKPMDVVAIESELTNRTRRLSSCPENKYQMGTYMPNGKMMTTPYMCSPVQSNWSRPTSNGLQMPNNDICQKK
jgi:hypothetical protein